MTKTTKTAKPAAARKGTRSLSTAEAVRKAAKATTKILDKPARKGPTTKILETALKAAAKSHTERFGAALQEVLTEKPASKPAKAGKAKPAATKPVPAPKAATASAKPATEGVKAPTGAKGKIIGMIDASKAGVSAGEIAKALGWPKAGGTISRAIKLAPFKVAKARDGEGVLRYSRA